MRNKIMCFMLIYFSICTQSFEQCYQINNISSSNGSLSYYSPICLNVAQTQPVSFTVGSGEYSFYSDHSITMNPGFVAATTGSSTNYFKAEIANQNLDVAILEPANINAVPLYSKVELGINIPSLNSKINTFLSDNTGQYKPGTTGYNNALANGTIINPYDPVHISVDAVFFKPSSPNANGVIRNGFYYNEYGYISIPGSEDWYEVETGIDYYEWRVRFSPDEIGLWHGFFNIWVNGVQLAENYFFSFNVVNSSIPGFVEISPNNQFLQFSNESQFFAVGDHYAWQVPTEPNQGCYNQCVTENCNWTNYLDGRMDKYFHNQKKEYIDKLTNTYNGGSGGGGNHTKLLFTPGTWEIEWERLGNYETRQVEMYELDDYISYCESKGVYITIDAFSSGEIIPDLNLWTLPDYSPGWEFNPYNNVLHPPQVNDPNHMHKGIDGLYEFDGGIGYITNPTARQFAKNKLRYINARWGYSPNFYSLEVYNELENYPGYYSDGLQPAFESWVTDMLDYAKNTLKMHQLSTVTFVGPGYADGMGLGPIQGQTTTLWSDPNVDVISGKSYFSSLDQVSEKNNQVRKSWILFNKPCIISESDKWNFMIMDQCNFIGQYNELWASCVSGAYGTNMSWEWRRYLVDDWYNSTTIHLENSYKTVRTFISNVDLVNYNYAAHNSNEYFDGVTNHPNRFENFYMIRIEPGSNQVKKVYGWYYNRSHNEYTGGDCDYFETDAVDNPSTWVDESDPNNDCFRAQYENVEDLVTANSDSYDFYHSAGAGYDLYFDFDDYAPVSTSNSQISFENLTPNTQYKIEFMYTTGPNAGTFEVNYDQLFTTNSSGKGWVYGGPPTGDGNPWDWAYIVHLPNEPRSLSSHHQWNPQQNINGQIRSGNENVLEMIQNISVAPNPNDGTFTVSIQSNRPVSGNVSLMDVSGNVIQSQLVNLFEGLNRINFSNGTLPAGVYFIRVDGYDEVLKVVVTK